MVGRAGDEPALPVNGPDTPGTDEQRAIYTNRPGHRLSGDTNPVMPGLDPGTRCISVNGYLSET
jgi:hypothetical protein